MFFGIWTLVALCVRLLFLLKFRMMTDDSFIYGDIAKNWLQHRVYGQVFNQVPEPTYIRMPGYPLFLILVWLVAGVEHYTAVLIAQIAIDILTCFVVADLARRIAGERASKIAFVLAVLCPFTANYTAVPLTETLAIFFAALAFNAGVAALQKPDRRRTWFICGVALACGIFLRPDGGILLAVFVGYALILAYKKGSRAIATGAVLASAIALLPLIPWTIRNWRAFHEFQPLTPFSATMPGEFVPHGFQRWSRTWIADYSSLEDVWFKVEGSEVTIGDLPPRAWDDEAQRQQTDQLLQAYVADDNRVSPELDAQFQSLARERIHRHPLRYYFGLPFMRAADLWMRPRTEMLPIDPHWWRLSEDDPPQFWSAVALGAVNFFLIVAALVALLRHKVAYAGLFIVFALSRTAFLAWMPNPEPRYVLECYPAMLAVASCIFEPATRHTG